MTLTVNGQPADPGCYVEGHWGQYGADHFADQLEGFGIVIPKLADARRARAVADWIYERTGYERSGTALNNLADSAWEWHSEAYDALINLANDATSADGYWEWHDGECFLRSYVCPECGRDATTGLRRVLTATGPADMPWEPCDYCCDADDPGCFA